MTTPAHVALVMFGLVALSGCFTETVDATTFVLDYHLYDLGEEARLAPPGEHCGTASLHDDAVEVYESPFERIRGADAYLFVDPRWTGSWDNTGDEPYLAALPGEIVSPDVEETMAEFGLRDGTITVDGTAVSLPHDWTTTAEDGTWRFEGSLREGPGPVRVVSDPRYGCD